MAADSHLVTSSASRPEAAGQSRTPGLGPGADGGWADVRVHGPQGAVDVALPTGTPVAELVAELTMLLPGAPLSRPGDVWHLHRLGHEALRPGSSLAAAQVRDGESLHLTREDVPQPAQPVDDGTVALAEGAAQVPRWTPGAVQVAAAAGLVLAAAGVAVLGLVVSGPVLPLVLVGALLMAALRLPGAADAEVGVLAAALASLPAWCCAGLGLAGLVGGGLPVQVTLAAAAGSVGSAVAVACVPGRAPWWAGAGALGVTLSIAGALVAGEVLDLVETCAVVCAAWLVLLALLPWLVTRTRAWREPYTSPEVEELLLARALVTRRVVDAVAVVGALAVAVSASVLAVQGGGMARGLAAAVAAVIGLRARRSLFLSESGGGLVAALAVLGVLVAVLARDGGLGLRLALLAGVVLLVVALVGLGVAARAAVAGEEETALDWWQRPRTGRTLDVLEVVAALAVIPLLLGVLGLYTVAADLGSRL